MKPRVYIETTVISYLTARPSRDLIMAARQEVTREVWSRLLNECECFVSALVVLEAGKGDEGAAARRLAAIQTLPLLHVGDEAERLAQILVSEKAIPTEYGEDALHVAISGAEWHGLRRDLEFHPYQQRGHPAQDPHVGRSSGLGMP